jgi:hypothetical protein
MQLEMISIAEELVYVIQMLIPFASHYTGSVTCVFAQERSRYMQKGLVTEFPHPLI